MKLLWVICDVTSVIQFYSGVARVLLLHIMYRNDGFTGKSLLFYCAFFKNCGAAVAAYNASNPIAGLRVVNMDPFANRVSKLRCRASTPKHYDVSDMMPAQPHSRYSILISSIAE